MEREIDFRAISWTQDPETAHAEALEIEAEREAADRTWDEYTADEIDDILALAQGGYFPRHELNTVHGVGVAPSRSQYNAAIKRRNPSAVIRYARKTVADQFLFEGEPTGFGLLCCPDGDECTVNDHPDGGCDDCNGGPGRGLYVLGKWGLIFGPKEVGKTWHMARAIKDAIDRSRNAIHYEYDDDPSAMPERLRLMGVSQTLINRHLLVIADHCETAVDASGKRKPTTPDVRQDFARNVAVVTLDAVTPAAVTLGLDSSGDTLMNALTHALIEPFLLGHNYLGDSYPKAYGIVADHVGHDNPDRPKNSVQKLAAVRSVAYQLHQEKVLGVGRAGCIRLILRKDRQSVHVGKRNGDTIAYMDVDGRDGVAVTIHDLAPDKRTAKSGKSRMGETKNLIHAWLLENGTSEREAIVRGLTGAKKANGTVLRATEIRTNLDRIKPDDAISALSGNRYQAKETAD